MGELTDQIIDIATASPTADALSVMRLSIIDWMACGLAGKDEPLAGIIAQILDAEGGVQQSTGFDGVKRPARATALYNGAVSHALDYDDTHFAHIGHVSVAVLPAVLALAEVRNVTIGDVVRAALIGTEAATRMGLALGRDHYEVGFHQTATSGAFGATLAAAQVLGLNEIQQSYALGLASTRAAGLKSQFGTMGKPYNAGLAAQTAVECAQLAALGMTSDPDGWDGARGFIATHHGGGDIGPAGFLMPQVSHKFHACCHGLHAALEALSTLKIDDVGQIARIEIKTHSRWMSVCNQPDPQTGLAAKFSYAAVTAFSLLGHATAAMDTFRDDLVQEPSVQSLMAKVSVSVDAALSEMQAQLRVVLVDGQELTGFHDLNAAQPLAIRQERILAKATALIGADRASSIAETVARDDTPVQALTALWNA